MNFLVDAQLPLTLVSFIKTKGHNVIHTNDLPKKDKTTDTVIWNIAINEYRILITKDTDFINSFKLIPKHPKILMITTGNITNINLLILFEKYFDGVVRLFNTFKLVELNNKEIIAHKT
jgi:predicted nuclease of predicted toxin-antitoxin system